jgi:hypothetical protein
VQLIKVHAKNAVVALMISMSHILMSGGMRLPNSDDMTDMTYSSWARLLPSHHPSYYSVPNVVVVSILLFTSYNEIISHSIPIERNKNEAEPKWYLLLQWDANDPRNLVNLHYSHL